jgi:hypothetical protein
MQQNLGKVDLHVIGSVLQGRDVDDEGKEEEHA